MKNFPFDSMIDTIIDRFHDPFMSSSLHTLIPQIQNKELFVPVFSVLMHLIEKYLNV
jgi:hypothetical protein